MVQALFALWLVTGLVRAGDSDICKAAGATSACQAATAAGYGIAVSIILALWTMVDVIMGVIYLVTRPR